MISGSQGESKDEQERMTFEEGSHSGHSASSTSEVTRAWPVWIPVPSCPAASPSQVPQVPGTCSVHSVAQLLSEGRLITTHQLLTPQPYPQSLWVQTVHRKRTRGGHLEPPLQGKGLPTVALRVGWSSHGLQQELDTRWLSTGFPEGQCSGTALHSHLFRSECGASPNFH